MGQALRAQESLTRIGSKTEVRSISFQFEDKNDLREDSLRTRISLTPQGSMVGLRKFFGFLPFVPPVGAHPFNPLELQRDVIRIRNQFHRSGYPKARVKYDVTYHSKPDVVDVSFVVKAGPPLVIDSLAFVGDSGSLVIPPDSRKDWAAFVKRQGKNAKRLGEDERKMLTDSTWRWFSAHGYPFAQARTIVAVDTAANTADVTVQAHPDMRARVRAVEVEGNKTAPPHHYARQLPVSRGRWFDGAALERSREQLTQMDLVRLALVDVPRDQAKDSTVAVRLNVTENPPHLIRGEVGIQAGGGLSTQTDWTDRSVFNGLRTFTVTGIAQTGLLALESPSEELYRLNLTLFQPYIGTRLLSASGGPFGEYRNDLRDRSIAAGFQGALVYAPAPFRSLSLGYSISYRRIYNFGFGENLDPSAYLPLLGLATPAQAGTLETSRNRSVFSLEGSYGRLDRIADPRKGYVFRPRVEISTPFFNTSDYLLLDMSATAFVPLTRRVGFTFRVGAGRVIPFGNSLDNVGNESPFVSLLRLRDVTFTAGGARDVRGWGSQLVGPKLPEVKFQSGSAGAVDTVADRYAPVGGLARLLGSAELQVPIPGMGEAWRGFFFFDSGKIWTPDSRFALNAGELDQDKYFAAVGAGVGYTTVVGALQVAVGYKLNPSPLDLRSPQDVLGALSSGSPIDPLPTSGRRRLHLHFSIGSTF
jgi:outer membrane protein insertion porin family